MTDKLIVKAREMGLEGPDILQYVGKQQAVEMDERIRERDAQRKHELELEALKLKQAEIEYKAGQKQAAEDVKAKTPRLPSFTEGEGIDGYLLRFERFARANHWAEGTGKDFRTSFYNIGDVRAVLMGVTFMALTATATKDVQEVAAKKLHLKKTKVVKGSLDRRNIFLVCKKVSTMKSLYENPRFQEFPGPHTPVKFAVSWSRPWISGLRVYGPGYFLTLPDSCSPCVCTEIYAPHTWHESFRADGRGARSPPAAGGKGRRAGWRWRATRWKAPKRAKSTQLSEMVRRLHNSDENEKKFDGKEGLNSPHNATVTSHLVKELAASGEYPPNAIRDACVGYYETIRRKFVNSLPENKEKALKQKKDKKQRSRRQRLMDARGTALQTEDERRLWTGVTVDLMSDEEDAVSNGIAVWLMKPPAFRSTQLSQLCGVLQTRLDTGGKHSDGRKPRIREEAAVSDRQPPESYDPDLAPLHFRPSAGRSLSFNDTDDTMSPLALECYNEPSFVEGDRGNGSGAYGSGGNRPRELGHVRDWTLYVCRLETPGFYRKPKISGKVCDNFSHGNEGFHPTDLGPLLDVIKKAKEPSDIEKHLVYLPRKQKCHGDHGYSHAGPMEETAISELDKAIKEFLQFYRTIVPNGTIPVKMHMLEDHVVPCIRQWGFGLGFLGEQGVEHVHALFNALARPTCTIPDPVARLKLTLTNHLIGVSPQNVLNL
ncbi:hypothetical protein Bbelb_344180 [Branchiostoma belcheri]|nr:hypothetical protein Bbelb_344180 [Branchiostoma belcheri]